MRTARVPVLIGALTVLTVTAAGIASADTPPQQRTGLWKASMTMMGNPFTTESCITAASQAKMSVFSSQTRQKNCSSSSISRNADGSWSYKSTCKFGNGAAHTSHAVIRGDFNSKLTLVMTTEGRSTPDMTMTMTWLGECKPGMKGGDVIMSNGMKMNMLDGTMSGLPNR